MITVRIVECRLFWRYLLVSGLLALLAGSLVSAQPYPGDLIQVTPGRVASPHTYGGLFHVNPQGQLVTVAVGSSYADLTMAPDNRGLAVAQAGGLKVIQPLTNRTVSTLWWGAPFVNPHSIALLHTGDYLVGAWDQASSVQVFMVTPNGSRLSTFRTVPYISPYWHMFRQDLWTGDVIEGNWSGLFRHRWSGGTATTLYSGSVNAFSQDPSDGSFLLATPSDLLRLHPRLGITTLRAGNFNHPAVDRAPGQGEIVTGQLGTLFRLDALGATVASYPGGYIGFRVCFLQEHNLLSRRLPGGPNLWAFDLDFPGENGRVYVLGLSATGFTPGIPVAGRKIPLVPDPLFFLSVTGGLGPWFPGHAGALDASGHAMATLDLSAFGSLLQGIRIWAAAATLDPNAPGGIATVSRPVVVVLD